MKEIAEPYQIFDDPIKYYTEMLEDIEAAKDYIFLQTYRVGNDAIGIRFKDALIAKARQGVKVLVLIDSWGGSSVSSTFFDELKRQGGQIRFFEKLKWGIDIFTRGHRRNHRKMLVIDDDISYIGSSNITDYNMSWRELMIRVKGDLALALKRLFQEDFKIYNKYVIDKAKNSRLVRHKECDIIRDVPSITTQKIKKKYVQLIRHAKRRLVIETPYFLPGYILRKVMMEAAARGVEVVVIIPKHSDVQVVDVLRNKYLGPLHAAGVIIKYYLPHNIHAKLLMVDDETYSIGSSNFDYRSFRYLYEIAIVGKLDIVAKQLVDHVNISLENSEGFNYTNWLRRPLINKFFEYLLLPFRHLL